MLVANVNSAAVGWFLLTCLLAFALVAWLIGGRPKK